MNVTSIGRSLSEPSEYAHPDALVEAAWLEEHLADPEIRIVESNEDVLLYDLGHIPGAAHIDWRRDLQDDLIRDYPSVERFAELCSRHGITPHTTVIFYGDKSNWWACYAFWVFELFGHSKLKILNGGREKWIREDRPLTRARHHFETVEYPVPSRRRDVEIRAFATDALGHSENARPLLDVRSPGEFKGDVTHMPEYPQEGVLRGGHIPGAVNIPWKSAANDDGTFKSRAELSDIYERQGGLQSGEDTIVYCRIGERSSHTWFTLKYLLGHEGVRNYDGSWCEWGNRIGVPIARGETASTNA